MTPPRTPRRGPGRPRTLPEGTTASDRAAMADAQLRAVGGHRFNLQLGAAAWAALQRMAGPRARGALISRLLLAEDRRQQAASANSAALPPAQAPRNGENGPNPEPPPA